MERYLSTFQFSSYSNTADDVLSAISDINFRMREGGIGYQYTDGEIIRIDSQFLHAEAVLPALQVLRLRGFEGAQSEFLRAHEHFRHARYSETLVECYKAFESTMEVIYDKRKWITKRALLLAL